MAQQRVATLLLLLAGQLLWSLPPAHSAGEAASSSAPPPPPSCPAVGAPCVAQRWAEAMAAGDGITASQESFIFTILHALHSLGHPAASLVAAGAAGHAVVVHTIGASKARELKFLGLFARLCEADMLPGARSVHVVLCGPDMDKVRDHGRSTVLEAQGACAVTVSRYVGVYDGGVAAAFPTAAEPDVVVGFNVDAYSCSFRPTVQYLLQQALPTLFTFYHPHESQFLLEQLAEPVQGFGPEAKERCVETLREIQAKGRTPKKVEQMLWATLDEWPRTFTEAADVSLWLPSTDELVVASGGGGGGGGGRDAGALAAFADNNPYGGQRGIGSGQGRPSVRGSPNAHLLGFVRQQGTGGGSSSSSESGAAAAAVAAAAVAGVFREASALRQREKRPIVGAFGPGETVAAIRKVLGPDYNTWQGPTGDDAGGGSKNDAGTAAAPQKSSQQKAAAAGGGISFEQFVGTETIGGNSDGSSRRKKSTSNLLEKLTKEGVGPYNAAAAAGATGAAAETAEQFFGRIDMNGNGRLDRKEIQRHRQKHWPTKSEL